MSEKIPTHFPTEPGDHGPRLTQPARITEQAWPDGTVPVVSIYSLAYNHESFIRDCLEGFLMQKTTFPVEILIHDDASSDNTANIIREYEARYPRLIKPIYQTENQYSKGKGLPSILAYPGTRGQYLAVCEGDDYWTSPLKLQKQVDFLDGSNEYTFCWTRFNTLDSESGKTSPDENGGYFQSSSPGVEFTFDTFLKGWHIGMQTFLCKLACLFEKSKSRKRNSGRDLFLIAHLLSLGKGYCLNEVTAVYRIHPGGIYSGLDELSKLEVGSNTYREIFLSYPENTFLKSKFIKFSRAYISELMRKKLYSKALNCIDEEIRLTKPEPNYKENLFQFIEEILVSKDKELAQESMQLSEIQKGWSFRIGRLITMPARGVSILLWKMAPRRIRNRKELRDRGVAFINKRQIVKDSKHLRPLPPLDSARTPKLIVSLTSFPERIPAIFFTLYSLLNQTVKPDMLLLWLAEEQFPYKEKDLPKRVRDLQEYGLTIKWCADLKSYKKLIPALKEYPNDIIVTADDDVYYPQNWLELLYESYLREPQFIHCHRAHRITFEESGKIGPYNNWPQGISTDEASYMNFLTGVGGVLYPPGSLYQDVSNSDLFMKLCPTADDIWFWAMAVLNDKKIRVVDRNIAELIAIDPELENEVKDGFTLYGINKNANDDQIKRVFDFYQDKLLKCKLTAAVREVSEGIGGRPAQIH
ncbi:MAG: glycosyltransferase family 2 protein [Vicinamibacteria bacterium]